MEISDPGIQREDDNGSGKRGNARKSWSVLGRARRAFPAIRECAREPASARPPDSPCLDSRHFVKIKKRWGGGGFVSRGKWRILYTLTG